MRTQFGSSGWILGGSHPSLQCSSPQLASGAVHILTAAKLQCIPDISVRDSDHIVFDRFSALKV